MHPVVVRNAFFPLAQYYAGRREWKSRLQDLLTTQWLSSEELKQLQLKRLRCLLSYATDTIPYYRNLFTEMGIQPDDIQEFDHLGKIPELDKEIINTNLERLYNPLFPVGYYKNTSSGSTGHPVAFYDDGIKAGIGIAEEARVKLNFGLPLCLREARFARLTEETISLDSTFRNRALLINQLIVAGMNLSESVFKRTKDKIYRFKPKMIFGISSALYEFTRYLIENKIEEPSWKVGLVICWAAPVFQHYVDVLSSFYDCPVVNLYSAREVGHMASSCPEGNLHLHEENRIFEVVRNGKSVAPGESGRIVVTTLIPTAMPMIRYNTDDIGVISPKRCSCGRSLTVLERLDGRTGEILYLSNGKIISPNYCCRLLMSPQFSGAIKQFQVTQKDGLSLEIKLVKTPGFNHSHAQQIIGTFQQSLGENVSIELVFTKQIEAMPSGKFQISRNMTTSAAA